MKGQFKPKVISFEMAIAFMLVVFLDKWSGYTFSEGQPSPLLIITLLFGIRYGWRTGLAVSFAALAYVLAAASFRGEDLYLMLFDFARAKQLLFLMLMGVVPGMFSSGYKEKYEEQYSRSEKLAASQVELMQTVELLVESRKVLEEKVLESEQSMASMLKIVQTLDEKDPENVFTGAVKVLASLFEFEVFGLYHVDKGGQTLRLKTGIGHGKLAPTLMVEKSPFLQRLMGNAGVQIRQPEDHEADPVMGGTLMRRGAVTELLVIHKLPLQRLTEANLRMLGMMLELISSCVDRAHVHYGERMPMLMYPHTSIHTMKSFQDRVELEKKRQQELNQPFALCTLSLQDMPQRPLTEWEALLRSGMRQVDILGYDRTDNRLHFLLPSTEEGYAQLFLKRMEALLDEQTGGFTWVS
ncbi:hypothetical protein MJA45_25580 [Paenibacillus aurantius]|uniref:GAF domain-containing protein n=1 Tax=Paenibacillus aurantius TaxID=2918900 RepID=A0AA96REJ2_9BACL|nr:hypothetical protein [Paenibacillus aurantius]WNQ10947.1 hypothetical protein MJA45_25580 [Paenibacillus aurantius]